VPRRDQSSSCGAHRRPEPPRLRARGSARPCCAEYIPTLSPFDESARPESRLDGGAFMRYRFDDKRLLSTLSAPPSQSLESMFAAGEARRL